MANEYILTSESVSEGHPDKVADRISDSILDAYLRVDGLARVACETLVTRNYVCVAGEVRSTVSLSATEIEGLVRETIREIGYVDADGRFSADGVEIDIRLHEQAAEIAKAVDKGGRQLQGAGDQGMMFGYATDEMEELVPGTDAAATLMPAPITWAHALTRRLAELRRASGGPEWLRPDAKAQVSVRYDDGRPAEVTGVVVSTQHAPAVGLAEVREFVLAEIERTLPGSMLPTDWQDRAWVNPSGSFVEGGPATDTGLTGRKIIVDTYGGAARHGGGAFSGKDASKVDRSAAYAARWVAKNVVAEGLARRCEICLAYAIGIAEPVAVAIETFGTERRRRSEIEAWIHDRFDLTPGGIIEALDLLRPIYSPTAAYGHFGREAGRDGAFPWEVVMADSGASVLT